MATASQQQSSSSFLKLPLELRQEIYHCALAKPRDTNSGINTQYEANIVWKSSKLRTTYWGTERMTRLLRVSRLIHDEVSQVLYSRCSFNWPQQADAALIHTVLDPLLPAARNYIRRIGFCIVLSTRSEFNMDMIELTKAASGLITDMLPNLRSVAISVNIVPFPIDSGALLQTAEAEKIVEAGMTMLTSFRKIDKLTVVGPIFRHDTIAEARSLGLVLVNSLRRRLRMGEWGIGSG